MTYNILTAPAMHIHDTFGQPVALTPTELQTLSFAGQQVSTQVEPMSVAVIAIGQG